MFIYYAYACSLVRISTRIYIMHNSVYISAYIHPLIHALISPLYYPVHYPRIRGVLVAAYYGGYMRLYKPRIMGLAYHATQWNACLSLTMGCGRRCCTLIFSPVRTLIFSCSQCMFAVYAIFHLHLVPCHAILHTWNMTTHSAARAADRIPMGHPTAPIQSQYGPADGDALTVWSGQHDGINQLTRMSVEGQTDLWAKVSA